MSVSVDRVGPRPAGLSTATLPVGIAKLAAFVRRDVRITLSYRTSAVATVLGLLLQVLVLSWIGKLIRPSELPEFGGVHVSYMEFVTIGMAVNMMAAILLYQVATSLRNEQMIGTLESLLCTPTAVWTLQLGSAASSILAIPLRLGVFLGALALFFGMSYHLDGVLPSIVIIAAIVPCLWGIGLMLAAAIVTFRRGHGAMGVGTAALALSSGAFFPVGVLPGWIQSVANVNPLTIAIRGLRDALLGGTGWASVGTHIVELAPLSIVTVGLGTLAFRLALKRERRNGTLGTY